MEETNTKTGLQSKKSKRYILLALIVVALMSVLIWWLQSPWFTVWTMHLAERKGEESSRAVCDRIVAHGERAVPAIISSIETNYPWVRRHCYLPIAFKEIGGSAQTSLLQAINQQSNPRGRAYLISSLHTAFGDYRRFGMGLMI